MAKRTDNQGRAYKRSQLQVQIAVNRHRDDLEKKLLEALPSLAKLSPELHWRSPLEDDRFREYWDGKLLQRVGRPELIPRLAEFWPSRGPHWDALAVAKSPSGKWLGPVLIEAKSHPAETRSNCGALGPRRRLIMRRLAETRAWLGVSDEHAGWWTNGLYQAANRLTFLRWWRGVLLESAWLANIYFVDDPSDHRVSTSRLSWLRAIEEDDRRLGIARDEVPGLGTVLIDGQERSQLIAG